MENKFCPSELIHIWKCEPCEAGDTLSGGERVAALKRLGLIAPTDKGYITTSRGKYIVERLIAHLENLDVRMVHDIAIFTPEKLIVRPKTS